VRSAGTLALPATTVKGTVASKALPPPVVSRTSRVRGPSRSEATWTTTLWGSPHVTVSAGSETIVAVVAAGSSVTVMTVSDPEYPVPAT
jgi:hypothetical protein